MSSARRSCWLPRARKWTLFPTIITARASQRCAGIGIPQTAPADALSEDWLGRTSQTRAYYGSLRDRYETGKPLWVTEVADAACGGDPWAATFLGTFRYLDQLGRLAKEGVQVVAHNILAASDYGLLSENDFTPRPNYWAALLWHRFMGSTVLDSGVPIQQGSHVYARCQPGMPGGVSLLAINNDRSETRTLTLPVAAQRYTLDADRLDDQTVRLNGQPRPRSRRLAAGADRHPDQAGKSPLLPRRIRS